MKSPIDQFKQLLSVSPLKSNDSSLEFIGEYAVKKIDMKNYETLLSLYTLFPKRDKVEISVFSDPENEIQIIESKRNKYEDLLNYADDELEIKIKISKSQDGVISIYDFPSFFDNFVQKPFVKKISQFIEMIKNNDFIYFDCFESGNVLFLKTDRIVFGNYDEKNVDKADKRTVNYIPTIMEKGWGKQILPDWFHIISSKDNPFSTIFKELTSLLSLFFISKTAELADNDEIKFFFLTEDISPTSFSKEKLLEFDFFEIYDWIFENDAYSDKLILTQNIIEKNKTAICTGQDIPKLLNIIKQSWNIHLMNDAEKYLKARNEIAENINNTFKEFARAHTYLIDKFRSNLIAIFTLFLTMFVSNFFSQGDFDKIFSCQITRIIELVFFLSILFFFIAIYEVILIYNNIKKAFDNLTINYKAVIENDTELKNEFNKERKKLKKTLFVHSIIWMLVLVGIFIAFENITDYPIIPMKIFSLRIFF